MIHLRPAVKQDISGIVNVKITSWQTTYQNIVPEDYLLRLKNEIEENEQWWTKNWAQAGRCLFVAEDQDYGIVGFACGGKERTGKYDSYKGELYAIYLLKDYQRQGIGRQLTRKVAEQLTQSGPFTMLVWALEENPSCMFYEKLGGVPIARQKLIISGKELFEVAYGIKDLSAI